MTDRGTELSREGENERDLVTREYHMRVTTALVAERDRYREALEVCFHALGGDHTKAGGACGEDACALCWAEAAVKEALGDA